MTAEVFTAVKRPPSTFSLERKNRGSAPIGVAGLAGLNGLQASSTVEDVLAILNEVTSADYVVDTNQMGRATSVLN